MIRRTGATAPVLRLRRGRAAAVVLAAVLVVAGASSLRAQGYPFSQRGVTQQTVAFTDFRIEYGRPVARGRTLFADSGLVPYGKVWHPGADSATRISISHDVLVDGEPLAAGEYSLWMVPRASGAWTLVFSRAAHVFHTPYPGEGSDVLRVDAMPERLSHMESMAIYFPVVNRDEAVMRVHWGEWALPVRFKAPWRPPDAR
jgi:hypothetical protein